MQPGGRNWPCAPAHPSMHAACQPGRTSRPCTTLTGEASTFPPPMCMQLARQAEAEAGTQAAWQEKQERRERRHVEIESQKERERRARAEQGRRVRRGGGRRRGGRGAAHALSRAGE